MAFPTVVTQSEGSTATDTTAHVITLPSGIVSGDLILIVLSVDMSGSDNSFTWPAGYTELFDDSAGSKDCSFTAGYRFADGTEGATITVTSTQTEDDAWEAWRISGAHASTAPEVGSFANGEDTAPEPPNLTPSWGAEDTLWFAIAVRNVGSTNTYTGFPANYTDVTGNEVNSTTGSAAANLGTAGRNLNATSENPGAFTIDNSDSWLANTIAVRPAAGGAEPLPAFYRKQSPLLRM